MTTCWTTRLVAQPTFTYETPGTHTVTLQVTDTRGGDRAGHGHGHRDRQRPAHRCGSLRLRTPTWTPANTSKNYGTTTKLRVDGNPKVESLLRFNVAGIAGTVQSAKLRLSALADGTADGPALYSAAGGWTETGVKWSNRPTFGATALGDKGAIAANSAVEYDVKSLVTGNGELNLGLRQTVERQRRVRLARGHDRRQAAGARGDVRAPDAGPGPGPDA